MTGETIKLIENERLSCAIVEHNQEIFMGTCNNKVIISDLDGNIKYGIDTKEEASTLCMTKKEKLVIG